MNRTLTVSRSMAIGDCFAAPNSVGPGAHTGFLGTTSVGANGFVLTAAGAPPIEFGLFYYGPEAAQVPFGDGFRCVGPGDLGLFRLQPPLTTDAAGALARAVDLTNPPEPAARSARARRGASSPGTATPRRAGRPSTSPTRCGRLSALDSVLDAAAGSREGFPWKAS